jgi:hypothetical protein
MVVVYPVVGLAAAPHRNAGRRPISFKIKE